MDAIVEGIDGHIPWWRPAVPIIEGDCRTLMPDLRIAAVVGERLYAGLAPEVDLIALAPSNWKSVLSDRIPNLILVEACACESIADWCIGPDSGLKSMLNFAKTRAIPTVLWITQDDAYGHSHKTIAVDFDVVFCTDFREAESLRRLRVNAEVLLPAVQPRIYNSFRAFDNYDSIEIGVLYEGLVDTDLEKRDRDVLCKARDYGLRIIEPRSRRYASKLQRLADDFSPFVLGYVDCRSRLLALKYSKAALFLESSHQSPSAQQWAALETAACRVPVMHVGRLPDDDVRKGIVMEKEDESEVAAELEKFSTDDLYRRKRGHLGWRAVYSQQTFSHRLKDICNKLGISCGWEEYPGASVVTPTRRIELLPRCLETFDRQTYPNKDMVIVVNRNSISGTEHTIRDIEARDDVQLTSVPEERYAGACLNLGNLMARGSFCFRLDDDDYYGENYLLDMMLHLRSVSADVFGKASTYVYFEAEGRTYERRRQAPELTILPSERCARGELRISGNTVGGRKEVLARTPYSDFVFASADTAFLMNAGRKGLVIATLDGFNVAAGRRSDVSEHTWTARAEFLKRNCRLIGEGVDGVMV